MAIKNALVAIMNIAIIVVINSTEYLRSQIVGA